LLNKKVLFVFVFFMAISVFITTMVLASEKDSKEIRFIFDNDNITDGHKPVVDDDTVYVPAKQLCNYLGADYEFSEIDSKISIYLADTTVELMLDMQYADVNTGTLLEFKSAPKMIDNEPMIPIDMLERTVGAKAEYNKEKNFLSINYFSLMTGKLTMGGDPAFVNFSQAAIDKLKKISRSFDAIVLGGGSSAGITSCANGEFDIGNITRMFNETELDIYKGLQTHRIAKEGIAIIVNPKNPVNDLELNDVCRLFEGRFLYWTAVKGGADAPVFVNTHEAGSGTMNTFYDIAIKGLDENGEYARTALPNSSNGLVRQAVASEPLAVGFVTFQFLDKTVKAVSLRGYSSPSVQSVIEKKWPLVNRLNVVTKGNPSGLKGKYINFLRSKFGKEILENEGFISLDNFHIDEFK